MALFGRDEYPLKRLRFSCNMHNGHYDVYMPLENFQITSDTSKIHRPAKKREHVSPNYIRHNLSLLRTDTYINLKDAICKEDVNIDQLGKKVILPSMLTGSARYMHEETQDETTYVRDYCRPDLFITFICNPKWEDLKNELMPGQSPQDCHDIKR